MSDWPQTLVLAGAGKMGGAMLKGWLAGGLPAAGVTVLEPSPSQEMRGLAERHGFALNPDAVTPPETLVLAIKPQILESAAPRLAADRRRENPRRFRARGKNDRQSRGPTARG